jgi:hypothetical protein
LGTGGGTITPVGADIADDGELTIGAPASGVAAPGDEAGVKTVTPATGARGTPTTVPPGSAAATAGSATGDGKRAGP